MRDSLLPKLVRGKPRIVEPFAPFLEPKVRLVLGDVTATMRSAKTQKRKDIWFSHAHQAAHRANAAVAHQHRNWRLGGIVVGVGVVFRREHTEARVPKLILESPAVARARVSMQPCPLG